MNPTPDAPPIRVLVVDDQAVVRAGLRMIINAEDDLTVIGEAADGAQAVRQAGVLRPDIVVMDVRMPRMGGLEATRIITHDHGAETHRPAVLVLTTFDDEEYLLGAIRSGASGFLLKDSGPDVLVGAIRAVHAGDALVDPAVTRALISRCLDLESRMTTAALRVPPATVQTLTAREREVLVGMAHGLSNRELADQDGVSETTVKSHVSAILTKLALTSRVQAVVLAYESGIVVPGHTEQPRY